jgi:Asp/Glu/hydantoin racemase
MNTTRLLLINPNTNTETTREMVQIALHEAEGSGTAVHSHCMT